MTFRLHRLYFFFKTLPFDVKQIIIDYAADDIWRSNVEEHLLLQEIMDVLEKGVFDDECSDIIYSCLPYIKNSHMPRKWHMILQKIGRELITNQYTGGSRSWCYHNTSYALNYVVKHLYDTKVFYNSLYYK